MPARASSVLNFSSLFEMVRRPRNGWLTALPTAVALAGAALFPASAFTPGETAAPAPQGRDIFTWQVLEPRQAWAQLVHSSEADRTRAYWLNAVAFLSQERGAEAIGMLDLVERRYPAAVVQPGYLLARGQALGLMRRYADAMVPLGDPALMRVPQACMWRLRFAAALKDGNDRSADFACAAPEIARLKPEAQVPFVVALAQIAFDKGDYSLGLSWIGRTKIADPSVQILLAKLLYAVNRPEDANKALLKVEGSGNEGERAEASLLRLQHDYKAKVQAAPQILKSLESLRYSWRDGDVELRALKFEYELARSLKDRPQSLAVGATLLRNFINIPNRLEMLADYRTLLVGVLDANSGLTIDQSIGLYWEYRDLAPDGAEGDRLAMLIASRLEEAGLYERAAQLLEYQLTARAVDIAKGPLSVRAGILNIRAGQFNRALELLNSSNGPRYPTDIAIARDQVAGVALSALRRVPEALAVLQDLPQGGYLTAEVLWHNQQWEEFVKIQERLLPRGRLGLTEKTMVFRQIIALTNLGRSDEVSNLRVRYRGSFAGQPELAAFDLLTSPADQADPEAVTTALTKLPDVSPAGAFGDLLNLAPPPKKAGS
jgi:hypothetical protein